MIYSGNNYISKTTNILSKNGKEEYTLIDNSFLDREIKRNKERQDSDVIDERLNKVIFP